MKATVMGVGVSVPNCKITQETAQHHINLCRGENEKLDISKLLHNTCIESRYMANNDLKLGVASEYEKKLQDRLKLFNQEALPIASTACLEAIKKAGISAQDIDKIVVVSSTGFSGPGLDCQLIKALNMKRTVDRTLIGFMGCAAAMNGVRVARDYVMSHSGKYALMCAIELSSVHLAVNETSSLNDLILHSIFADGCAAVVMKAQAEEDVQLGTIIVMDDHSMLADDTEDGIVLDMKHNGITCTLSKELPLYIKNNIKPYVDSFLKKHSMAQQDIKFWAVHPGGKRIIESSQIALGLTAEDVEVSWLILKKYGNMLSPSVLFVLDEMQKRGQTGVGMAFSFSPGVGIEGLLLRMV